MDNKIISRAESERKGRTGRCPYIHGSAARYKGPSDERQFCSERTAAELGAVGQPSCHGKLGLPAAYQANNVLAGFLCGLRGWP